MVSYEVREVWGFPIGWLDDVETRAIFTIALFTAFLSHVGSVDAIPGFSKIPTTAVSGAESDVNNVDESIENFFVVSCLNGFFILDALVNKPLMTKFPFFWVES